VVADDRPGSVSNVPVAPTSTAGADASAQSASFDIGNLRLELSASPGAARLVVSDSTTRDVYVVDPAALASWSRGVGQVASLQPASTPPGGTETRTPFLIDREGRASIAVEALVSQHDVGYRVVVCGAAGRVATITTVGETIRELAEAAAGAVLVAQRVP